jgi:hypothetical protein
MRFKLLFAALAAAAVLALLQPGSVAATLQRVFRLIELGGEPVLASVPVISDHEIEELKNAPAQEQAERLLERAINGYRGANELLEAEVDDWMGKIEYSGRLESRFNVAIDSSNLRVRAAAIEIYLASFAYPKSSESVDLVMGRLRERPDHLGWYLWILGMLANRDVERDAIFDYLVAYVDDADQTARHGAVNALALTGDERAVPVLLEVFRDDPSPAVRERAACGLAQSGMFTEEVRMTAVPDLLDFSDDPRLDDQTRKWVFQALRDITGQVLPADPAAWRDWWYG